MAPAVTSSQAISSTGGLRVLQGTVPPGAILAIFGVKLFDRASATTQCRTSRTKAYLANINFEHPGAVILVYTASRQRHLGLVSVERGRCNGRLLITQWNPVTAYTIVRYNRQWNSRYRLNPVGFIAL